MIAQGTASTTSDPPPGAERMAGELSQAIRARAREIGFDLVGIAPAVVPQGFSHFQEWLARGHAGEMGYMQRQAEARAHPRHVLDGVRSVVMVAMNYGTTQGDSDGGALLGKPAVAHHSEEAPAGATAGLPSSVAPGGGLTGRVSRYAGGIDYHLVLKRRLSTLQTYVTELVPASRSRAVVDTAPLLERDFARMAGLGWIGKNTMLINKRVGSWFFLGALLVDFALEYDEPHDAQHCGTCRRCLDACPTDAFVGPYQLDSRRCISYLTIELRGPIPPELRPAMGDWVFGCDVCQDVCPWNRKAPVSRAPAFHADAGHQPLDLVRLLRMSETEVRETFAKSALLRAGRRGLLRNAAIALGNLGSPEAVPALTVALNDADEVVRGAAAWALGEIGGFQAIAALRKRESVELITCAQQELAAAIESARLKTRDEQCHRQPTQRTTQSCR